MNVWLKEAKITHEPRLTGSGLYDFTVKELKRIFSGQSIIRWSITKSDPGVLNVVAAVADFGAEVSYDLPDSPPILGKSPFVVVQVVPTGVGASIGGYAGDAAPTARLLASVADIVVTHPNVVNASDFYGGHDNILYVEGFALDQFMLGHVALLPRRSHRIGLVVDEVTEEQLSDILTSAEAIRSVYGTCLVGYSIVEGGIGGTAKRTSAGTYDGYLENPRGLLETVEKLISNGATAIAIISKIKGVSPAEVVQHYMGSSPHPLGGVEAIISRLVSSRFSIPAAHAPVLDFGISDKTARELDCDLRTAGEVVSRTGLPCVLLGLSKAPSTLKLEELSEQESPPEGVLTNRNVAAVVAPSSAMGGVPMLVCEKLGIPVISVEENTTVLDVTGTRLGLTNEVRASNYLEAAGIVAALKAGLDWNLVRRPVRRMIRM